MIVVDGDDLRRLSPTHQIDRHFCDKCLFPVDQLRQKLRLASLRENFVCRGYDRLRLILFFFRALDDERESTLKSLESPLAEISNLLLLEPSSWKEGNPLFTARQKGPR